MWSSHRGKVSPYTIQHRGQKVISRIAEAWAKAKKQTGLMNFSPSSCFFVVINPAFAMFLSLKVTELITVKTSPFLTFILPPVPICSVSDY
jgi:hypothetical protein